MCIRDRYYTDSLPVLQTNFFCSLVEGRISDSEINKYLNDYQISLPGSYSVSYTHLIAACVVGGVSFTGGIGKISGVVTGVLIFTALTYSLTILGIDTNPVSYTHLSV